MSYVVLIDVGGTFLKGSTVVPGQQSLNMVRRIGPTPKTTRDNEFYLEPGSLKRSVIALCTDLVDSSPGECSGIFLTGQMHGVVLTDRSGNAVTDVVTWRDSLKATDGKRLVPSPEAICREIDPNRLAALGNELRDGIPLATLYARRSHGQLVDGLVPHSLLSFCGTVLCDSDMPALMHVTDAAAHGFYNLETSGWDIAVLEDLGLGGMELPTVVNHVEMSGFSKIFGCPVYTPVGDHQAALFGVDLAHEELSLNIATGSQVSFVTDEPSSLGQCRPYFEEKFLSTVTHIPAGRALNQLINLVGELADLSMDETWERVSQLTAAEPYSSLKLDLSFFPCSTGESGGLANVLEGNLTVGNLFRAAINEMVSNYRLYSRKLMPDQEPSSVVVSGGLASRFPPLSEALFREFSASNVRVTDLDDASLYGLSKLAQI